MTQDADEADGFRPVADLQAALAWIPQDIREDGDVCGMDASGWEDDTWILHDLTVPIDLADREEGHGSGADGVTSPTRIWRQCRRQGGGHRTRCI
jgi:hypothetical protein